MKTSGTKTYRARLTSSSSGSSTSLSLLDLGRGNLDTGRSLNRAKRTSSISHLDDVERTYLTLTLFLVSAVFFFSLPAARAAALQTVEIESSAFRSK